jgi:hypothetical protein
MSGNKCQYLNCGKSKKKFPNLKMYRFPKDERKEIWIINSGKEIILNFHKALIRILFCRFRINNYYFDLLKRK